MAETQQPHVAWQATDPHTLNNPIQPDQPSKAPLSSTKTMSNRAGSSDSKGTKRDFSTAILERKKAANRLVIDEAINDDNSVVALHPNTMEKL